MKTLKTTIIVLAVLVLSTAFGTQVQAQNKRQNIDSIPNLEYKKITLDRELQIMGPANPTSINDIAEVKGLSMYSYNNTVQVSFVSAAGVPTTIVLYDMSGRVILKDEIVTSGKCTKLQYQVNGATGIVVGVVFQGNQMDKTRFLIQ